MQHRRRTGYSVIRPLVSEVVVPINDHFTMFQPCRCHQCGLLVLRSLSLAGPTLPDVTPAATAQPVSTIFKPIEDAVSMVVPIHARRLAARPKVVVAGRVRLSMHYFN